MNTLLDRIRSSWHILQHKYSWSIIDDSEAFVAEVITALAHQTELDAERLTQSELHLQIINFYNIRLHAMFFAATRQLDNLTAIEQTNRAATEVYRMAWGQSRKHVDNDETADDFAQRIVERLIAGDMTYEPKLLWLWIKNQAWALRSSFYRSRKEGRNNESLPEAGKPLPDRLVDTGESFTKVDDALLGQQILVELPNLLNDKQLQVFTLLVLEEVPPQQVADQLQTNIANVRVIKSRALAILRQYASTLGLDYLPPESGGKGS